MSLNAQLFILLYSSYISSEAQRRLKESFYHFTVLFVTGLYYVYNNAANAKQQQHYLY